MAVEDIPNIVKVYFSRTVRAAREAVKDRLDGDLRDLAERGIERRSGVYCGKVWEAELQFLIDMRAQILKLVSDGRYAISDSIALELYESAEQIADDAQRSAWIGITTSSGEKLLDRALQDWISMKAAKRRDFEDELQLIRHELDCKVSAALGKSHLCLLFLSSNPASSTPLALDEEMRDITTRVERARGAAADDGPSLEIVSAWAVRATDLLHLLNKHRPDIVHFSGHGSHTGALVFCDDAGQARLVKPEALKQLFNVVKDNVKVVVLNACYSEEQATEISTVVDYVVGMREAVGDVSARIFASHFYSALAFGRTVDEAYEQGKVAVVLENAPDDGLPVLLKRPPT